MSRISSNGVDYQSLIQPDRVHGSLYHSPAVFADEMEHIFHRGWVFVAHESEIPKQGDYLRRKIGLQSVIVLRDPQGAVRIFYDRCPHRGNQLSTGASGNVRGFVCPYHGWSFNLCGELINAPWQQGFGPDFDPSKFGLSEVARCEVYAGFVFASLAAEGLSLTEHLGHTCKVIDQLNGVSPVGRLRISAGWMRHRIFGNWKGVFENHLDGYHAPFTHSSLVRSKKEFAEQRVRRDDSGSVTMDYGMGHGEVDLAGDFRTRDIILGWTGGIPEERVSKYVSAMREAYGPEESRKRLINGPPHATIFPNLMIAELNLMIAEPVSADELILLTTPVLFEGGEELNERNMRRCEGALGPAGLLFADDAEIAQLCQSGMQNQHPEWAMLTRGLHSEELSEGNVRIGALTDETPQRGFWRHYQAQMEG